MKETKKFDEMSFDMTKVTSEQRRLIQVLLQMYFARELTIIQLEKLVKGWNLPIITY